MILKYAVIIECQFKNMFPNEQVPVISCEPEVIVNTLLSGSQEFPCSSFHTWTLQCLQQFSEFKNVQETLAGPVKQNVNKENKTEISARIRLLPDSISTAQHWLRKKKRVLSSLTAINKRRFLFIC